MRLVGGQVLDLESGRFEKRDIGVEDGRFGAAEAGDEAVELDGAYILPGFFDCHVHMTLDTQKPSSIDVWHGAMPGDIVLHTARNARRALMCGITTAREVGGWDYHEIAVRNAINAGMLTGTRLFCAGKILTQTCATTPYYPGMYHEADGPMEVRKAARVQLAMGADLIKIMATGALTSSPYESAHNIQYRPDEIRAAVEIAADNGKHVAAHAHAAQGVINAAECGCRTVEHSCFGNKKAYETMVAHGTWLVPTICVSHAMFRDPDFSRTTPDHIRERYRAFQAQRAENINLAYKLGVKLAMGTDMGTAGNHAGHNMQELTVMVEHAGVTPIDAIRSATTSAAEMMGLEARLGSIAPGKIADAIACNRNPLEDIRALEETVFFVMKDGKVVRNDRTFKPEPDGLVIH